MSSSGVYIHREPSWQSKVKQNRIACDGNGRDAIYKTAGKKTKREKSGAIMQSFNKIWANWASPRLPCFGSWKVVFGSETSTSEIFCSNFACFLGVPNHMYPSTRWLLFDHQISAVTGDLRAVRLYAWHLCRVYIYVCCMYHEHAQFTLLRFSVIKGRHTRAHKVHARAFVFCGKTPFGLE